MAYHVPEEETLEPPELHVVQRRKLAAMLSRVLPANPFYAEKFAGSRFDGIRDPLDRLPITTRAEIQEDQARAYINAGVAVSMEKTEKKTTESKKKKKAEDTSN